MNDQGDLISSSDRVFFFFLRTSFIELIILRLRDTERIIYINKSV